MGERIVGRRRELVALRGWLDASRHGSGRLVLCVGEPGIGKTRLAHELAGIAADAGVVVAWGRCAETAGAPAFWPWRQVLRSLGVGPDSIFAGSAESSEDRFRLFEEVTEAVLGAAAAKGLVVIVDDLHLADEPSLSLLLHLAPQLSGIPLLVVAAFRDVEPTSALPRVLPELLRSPSSQRLDLHGFELAEVRDQLSDLETASSSDDARAVLDVTAGNPLFVREVARAIADGTWRPDRPPRSVLDLVSARLDRVTAGCRRLVQAAAVFGREFPLVLVAATLGEPIASCLPLVDEAIGYGLLEQVGDAGDYRFVHALTRDAVEGTLTTAEQAGLHRAAVEAKQAHFADDLSEHLVDIAGHWARLAPYGEAVTARDWAIRAAEHAVASLAYEQAVRLYRSALALDPASLPDVERAGLSLAMGRAAYLAGELDTCVEAARGAAAAASRASSAELAAEAALVIEPTSDRGLNAVAHELCEQALAGLGGDGHDSLRARLLAQRSHLAFHDGEQGRIDSASTAALDLARESGDDRALTDALRARQEACPGPAGVDERLRLAGEMSALGQRTGSARAAMWGELWRIDALVETGRLAAAVDELGELRVAVERVGGPVSAWHLHRAVACVAQAQGRYAAADGAGRRGYERMRKVEPASATGTYFALQCALAMHVGVTDAAAPFVTGPPFEAVPRFATIARLHRAFLLLRAAQPGEASAAYQQAGPPADWSLPAFYTVPGHIYGALIAAELGRHDHLAELLGWLGPFKGQYALGNGVAFFGPIDLALGRGAAALSHLDSAVAHLTAAVTQADRAGAPGFAAEAGYHLAATLLARDGPGDVARADSPGRDADRLARALGMAAYVERTAALVAHLDRVSRPAALSRRESEVAKLVADGLTNRQIAAALVISDRTVETHVQHILTKLGFTTRSQIAAWTVRTNAYTDQ